MYQSMPPKGMRDFLPGEKMLRDQIAAKIRRAYTESGFTEIETSAVEHLENLTGGDGGENQKLIFKILKRGEKLSEALKQGEIDEDSLADLGLRFDFTLPLSRFYANNRNELPTVFKAIQMGMVYRGERPQKGRFRSFVQCDIDIIGEPGPLAEVEILNAAIKALDAVGLRDYEVLISDRRFLTALVEASNLPSERADEVCISLDKLDKIGRDGVLSELASRGLDGTALLDNIEHITLEDVGKYCPEAAQNLRIIMNALSADSGAESGDADPSGKSLPRKRRIPVIRFEPTLVRGMGYYTATIFEVYSPKYGSALGGGGRYDKMIGKISGSDVPAAGFSIGFERICDLLSAESASGDAAPQRTALLVSDESEYGAAIEASYRIDGITSIFTKKKKFGKQLQTLEKEGFHKFFDVSKNSFLS